MKRQKGSLKKWRKAYGTDGDARRSKRRWLVRLCGSRPTLKQICKAVVEVGSMSADSEPRVPRSMRSAWRTMMTSGRARFMTAEELIKKLEEHNGCSR